MALEITADFPDFEKGLEMEVAGVLVKNGSTVKLTDDQEAGIVSRHGSAVKDALGDGNVKVTGTASMTPAKVEAAKEGGEN